MDNTSTHHSVCVSQQKDSPGLQNSDCTGDEDEDERWARFLFHISAVPRSWPSPARYGLLYWVLCYWHITHIYIYTFCKRLNFLRQLRQFQATFGLNLNKDTNIDTESSFALRGFCENNCSDAPAERNHKPTTPRCSRWRWRKLVTF